MHARAPLFSSHVQPHNKVLIYKLKKKKKTFSLFHVGHNFLFLFLLKKLIVYNNPPHFSKERKTFVFKTYCLEYGRRC